MASKLFKGSTIINAAKQKKTVKLTRSQTAKKAAAKIRSKYGSVSSNDEYYHRGEGDWIRYSLKRDNNRTSKNVLSKKPKNFQSIKHKVDVKGVDTKKYQGKKSVTGRETLKKKVAERNMLQEQSYKMSNYSKKNLSRNEINKRHKKWAAVVRKISILDDEIERLEKFIKEDDKKKKAKSQRKARKAKQKKTTFSDKLMGQINKEEKTYFP